jgi:hypothetical protein
MHLAPKRNTRRDIDSKHALGGADVQMNVTSIAGGSEANPIRESTSDRLLLLVILYNPSRCRGA